MLTLAELGPRICIMGPSNSGKSTLAVAIGDAKGLEVVHLDRLRHLEGEYWALRPDDEFAELHQAAIDQDKWVMEGNYSRLLPQRLARATGFILMDVPVATSLLRYIGRTLGYTERYGALSGVQDRLSGKMIYHLLTTAQKNRRSYKDRFAQLDMPKVLLDRPSKLDRFYQANQLPRRPRNSVR